MIAYLGLIVALWIIWRREPVDELILGTEGGYFLAGEVRLVIEDDSVREAKATHNVLPHKLDHLVPSDFKERHNFNPFCEVVGCDQ